MGWDKQTSPDQPEYELCLAAENALTFYLVNIILPVKKKQDYCTVKDTSP
jgi:hypothetical protein